MSAVPHDVDLYAWAERQAGLLRAGRLSELDVDYLAQELDSIMGNERRELVKRFRILIAHLLKWRYQPEARSSGWRGTIAYQRDDIDDVLADSPSLRPMVPDKIAAAYPKAVALAARETGRPASSFPQECPFTPAELLDAEFWPD
jgi:hypothetical protein